MIETVEVILDNKYYSFFDKTGEWPTQFFYFEGRQRLNERLPVMKLKDFRDDKMNAALFQWNGKIWVIVEIIYDGWETLQKVYVTEVKFAKVSQ